MKKLEELGISPWPWKVAHWVEKTNGKPYTNIGSSDGFYVADGMDDADKRLIAAAPELYECLREAVIENCHECGGHAGNGYKCFRRDGECFVQKWRAALRKAAGESEVHNV